MIDSFRNKLPEHAGLWKILCNTGWLFSEQFFSMGIALLVGIYMVRFLGPTQFGVYSYILSFVGLFGVVAKVGLDAPTVRDIVRHPEETDAIMGTVFLLKMIGGSVALVLACLTVHFLNRGQSFGFMVLIVAFDLVVQAFDVINFWFQSQVLSKSMAMARMSTTVIISFLKLILISNKATLIGFFWLTLADSLLRALWMLYHYVRHGQSVRRWAFKSDIALRLLKASWPLLLSTAMAATYMKIDQVMLEAMAGSKAVGLYSGAVKISEIWYFIPMAITSSVFPAIIQAKQRNEKLYRERMQMLFDLMVWLALGIACVLTVFSDRIVSLLLGADYAASIPILSVHIWAGVFVFLEAARIRWLISEGLSKYQLYTTFWGALSNIGLNLLLIPRFGGLGSAIATLVSYAIAVYFSCFFYPRLWPLAGSLTKAMVSPLRLRRNMAILRERIEQARWTGSCPSEG